MARSLTMRTSRKVIPSFEFQLSIAFSYCTATWNPQGKIWQRRSFLNSKSKI
jgi:hypothetical protein